MFKNYSTMYTKNLESMINELSQKSIFNLDFKSLPEARKVVKELIYFIYDIDNDKHFEKLAKKRTFNDINEKLLFLSEHGKLPDLKTVQEKIFSWLDKNYIYFLGESVKYNEDYVKHYQFDKNIDNEELVELVSFTQNGFNEIPYDNFKHIYNVLGFVRNGNIKISDKFDETTRYFYNLPTVYSQKHPISLLSKSCPNYIVSEPREKIDALYDMLKKDDLKFKVLKTEDDIIDGCQKIIEMDNMMNSNTPFVFEPNKDISDTMTSKQEIFFIDLYDYSLDDILNFKKEVMYIFSTSRYNRALNNPFIVNMNPDTFHQLSYADLNGKNGNMETIKLFLHNSNSKIMNIKQE